MSHLRVVHESVVQVCHCCCCSTQHADMREPPAAAAAAATGKLTETQVLLSHASKLHLDRYGFIVTEAEAHARAGRIRGHMAPAAGPVPPPTTLHRAASSSPVSRAPAGTVPALSLAGNAACMIVASPHPWCHPWCHTTAPCCCCDLFPDSKGLSGLHMPLMKVSCYRVLLHVSLLRGLRPLATGGAEQQAPRAAQLRSSGTSAM